MDDRKNKTGATEEAVEAILARIRPYIQMHGGDVVLEGVADGVAKLKLYGACVDCQLADITYNRMLTKILKDEVPGVTKVELG